MSRQILILEDLKTRTIDTEYGLISYEEFCTKEAKRIGGSAKAVSSGNMICVTINKDVNNV